MFIKGLRINEAEYDLENGNKGKVAVFLYGGEDPKPILDYAVRIYVDGNQHYELIDAQLNCPCVRVVLSNIKDMKQENFTDYMKRKIRFRKLKEIRNS
jgi:hypothetical protein